MKKVRDLFFKMVVGGLASVIKPQMWLKRTNLYPD